MRPDPSTIAIYARVSTEEQARQQEGSLDSQIHRCKHHLLSHFTQKEVDQVRIYREEGASGKDLNRPAFQEIMRDIRRGILKHIVFTELSRISRNVHDFLGLSSEWERYGVQFTSLREKFDTTSPHGRLIITILVALNQFEREQIGERTRANMRARAERGLFSGGTVPLGYKQDPMRNGMLLIDEEEAPLVRAAFDAYLETGSMRLAAQQLKQRGLQRPLRITRTGKNRESLYLTREHLRHMLPNPSYAGLKEINRLNRDRVTTGGGSLPREERYALVEAVWEPIISMEMWERTQDMIAESDRTRTNITKKYTYNFTLSGIAYCVGCGAPLHGASAKGQTYFYYQHPNDTYIEGICPQRRWTAEVVEKSVLSRLSQLAKDEALLQMVIEQTNARLTSGLPALERELTVAREQLGGKERESRALVARLVAMPQNAVPESFWEAARELEAQAQHLREEINRISRKRVELEAARLSVGDYRQALQNFDALYTHLQPNEQSRLLACLIDRVVLEKEQATMWLLGEEKVNPSSESSPRGVTSSGVTPLGELACLDNFALLWPEEEVSQWRQRRERRAALREEKERDPPAAKALRQALEWEVMLRRRGWTRSRLADEVGYTRARVTQIMHLLHLPYDIRVQLLEGNPEVAAMTIREAIALARSREPGRRTIDR